MAPITTLLLGLSVSPFGTPVQGASLPSLDPSFDVGDGPDGPVLAVAVQPDGRVLAGGQFQFVGGQMYPGLARFGADGHLDQSFAANDNFDFQLQVTSVLVQPDGEIVMGGQFQGWSGHSGNGIARLNPDGSPDSGFNPGTGANDIVQAVVRQGDGKLLLAGKFTAFNGQARSLVVRLNSDGSVDPSFTDNGALANSTFLFAQGALCLAQQGDGKILVGGDFQVNGSADGLARLNSDGTLDTSFKPPHGLNNDITSLLVRPDGEILIAGDFTFNQSDHLRAGLLNSDGSVDQSFTSPNSNDLIRTLVRQPADGNILVGGGFSQINGASLQGLARLDPHGALDSTFDPGGILPARVNTLVLQADGTAFVGTDNGGSPSIKRLLKLIIIPAPPVLQLPDTSFNFVSSHPDNNHNWIFNVRQPSSDAGVSVRIQSTQTPGVEASWTDLPGGGQMTRLDSSTWQLATDGIPTGSNISFRAIAAEPGFADSLSKTVQGPFNILLGLNISDPQPSPALAGHSWTFVANQPVQVPGTSVRVQSTLTPAVEASWTDLPDGPMSQLDPTPLSYWAWSTTSVPTGQRFFRAISAVPGQPDSISIVLGPYGVVPDLLIYGQTPLNSTMPYRFEVHDGLAPADATARIQTTSTPAIESSWTDLPGATSLNPVWWGWSQVAYAVPAGEAVYFRSVTSRTGDPDILSLPAGPLQIRMALTVNDAGDALLFLGPDPQPGQVIRVQSSPTPNVEQSWTDLPGGQLAATGAITVSMSNVPTGAQWFRIIASSSGQADGFSAAVGPFQITPQSFGVGAGGSTVFSPSIAGNVNNSGLAAASLGTLSAAALADVLPGAGVVATGGGNLLSPNGGTVVSHDGGTVVSHDGGTVISNDGGSVISNDGGSLLGDHGSELSGGIGSTFQNDVIPALRAPLTLQSLAPLSMGAPGLASLTTIHGNYTQTPGGTLAIAIAGTNAAGTGSLQYDRLEIAGTALLSGRIAFSLLDPNDPTNNARPFQPLPGSTFDVVLASQLTTTNLVVRGPIWGTGLTMVASTVSLPDGRQALRLTATNFPPPLGIGPNGAAFQVVYPTNYVGFTLQSSTNLAAGSWSDLSSSTNRILIAPPRGDRFFRLIKRN